MPELPEVEVTRLSLVDRLRDARITGVRVGKPLRWPLGCAAETLVGRQVRDIRRRGKYLWLALDAATDQPAGRGGGLLVHLGMSGSLNLSVDAGAPGPWDHFDLATSRGLLRLTDPRRFGAVVWSPALDLDPAAKLLAGLGVEPLAAGFDAATLHRGLQGRRVAVKQALLAGDIVVGVGNIYASEALYHAGIDPRTASRRISRPRSERLVDAIRQVLARAVALGGSTLRDFRDAHGAGGAFQLEAQVYDRAGQPCRRCGTPIRRIVQGQRSTYFCPQCQRR